ncbi:MAG: hypothetical protein ACKVTZ_23820 [Bacteroidia bacterium]
MFRQFQKFNPPFMQKIDKHLLLHHPSIWATKIHYVAFFLGIYTVFLRAFSAIYPIRLENLTDPEYHFWVSAIPLMIAFGVWVYQLTLFKVENQFGQTNFLQQLRTQGLLFLTGFMFITPPFLYSDWLGNRISHKVTTDELVKDINSINLLAQYMGTHENLAPYVSYHNKNRDFFETHCLNLEQVSDKMRNKSESEALHDIQVGIDSYHKWSSNTITESAKEILAQYKNNYYEGLPADYFQSYRYDLSANFRVAGNSLLDDYFFQQVEAKAIISIFVIAFVMLLFVFLKVGLKTFLITCITVVLGWIVAGFTTVFAFEFLGIRDENVIFALFWTFLVGFTMLGYSNRNTQRFLQWKKVAISIATGMIPFVPVILVAMTDLHRHDFTDRKLQYQGIDILPFLFVVFSLSLGFFTWNVFFNPQLQKLHATPSQN